MDYINYALTDYWIENQDPRIVKYPLMSSGMIPLLWLVALYIVTVVYIGPWLMRNRKPFELRRIILVYNLFNIVSNLYFLYLTLKYSDRGRMFFKYTIEPRDDYSERAMHIVHNAWLYLVLKLSDLIETIFFVMRHKQSQVTFLHVYHHSSVPILVWMTIKLFPIAGPAGMFPLLNCSIHVVMYTYYFLAALGPKYQRYLWWKKYITVFQLTQFVIFIVHGIVFSINQEGFPLIAMLFPNIQSPLFFGMFYNFFKQSYRKQPREKLQ